MKKSVPDNKLEKPELNNLLPVKVVYSYSWSDITDKKSKVRKTGLSTVGFDIIKKIEKMAENKLKNEDVKYDFRRLRASAGTWLFNNVFQRMSESDIIIVDITRHNSNVLIELGIALTLTENDANKKLFVLQNSADKSKIPSNILGLFITFYTVKNNKITFNDQNSLREAVIHQIRDIFQNKNQKS